MVHPDKEEPTKKNALTRLKDALAEKLPHSVHSGWLKQTWVGAQHTASYVKHVLKGNNVPTPVWEEGGQLPVFLLHGFLGTQGSMSVLKERLEKDDYAVCAVHLGTLNVRDIRASAFLLYKQIEAFLENISAQKVDLIGHSMGGLIALYYIKYLGGHQRVRRLIMLGTPVRGTWTALAGVATLGLYSTSAWQLLPGSSFLRTLMSDPLPAGVECFSIAADRDRICPPETTYLDGVHRISVPFGHASLVFSEEVYEKIAWVLKHKEDEHF